jgi:hypothetical protein
MNLLLAKPAQDEIRRLGSGASVPVKRVIDTLTSIDARSLEQNPRVHLVERAEGNIFVIKIGGLRAFFTRKDQDLVVLSITNG